MDRPDSRPGKRAGVLTPCSANTGARSRSQGQRQGKGSLLQPPRGLPSCPSGVAHVCHVGDSTSYLRGPLTQMMIFSLTRNTGYLGTVSSSFMRGLRIVELPSFLRLRSNGLRVTPHGAYPRICR